jgi:hypothetical protein
MSKNDDNTNNKPGFDELPVEQQARWLCLMEAVNVSANFAEKSGIDTDTSYKWIKPSAYNAYIKEMFPSMRLRLEQEARGLTFDD